MTSRSVLTRTYTPADRVLRYGSGPDHLADLWLGRDSRKALRKQPSPVPLVIFLHGGFWRAEFGRAHAGPLAAALAGAGFAVCVPEYRRTGQPGGGWPGTFDDVAAAVGLLPELAAEEGGYRRGFSQIILAGHSAGGHLALWAASRRAVAAGPPGPREPRGRAVPSRLAGVVGLAAVSDLAACYEQNLGDGAAAALMGGGPLEHPDRYGSADPAVMVPAGPPVRLLHGTHDDRVPWQQSRDYAARATLAGASVTCEFLPDADHFALIDPLNAVWPQVVAAFRAVITADADAWRHSRSR